MNGRPLRFLGLTLGLWVTARAAMLWPVAAPLPALVHALAPPAAAAAIDGGGPQRAAPSARVAQTAPSSPHTERREPPRALTRRSAAPSQAATPPVRTAAPAGLAPVRVVEPTLPPPLPPTPPDPVSRLSGSAWVVARRGGDDRSVPGAQLGGSQAGVRLAYALGTSRRVAVAARVSTPLAGRGREAALGIEWRPVDAPIRLVAERRWSLDGGRGGPTLMAVAGLPPTRVGALTAEAYAQGGAIERGRIDGFVDGAARLSAPLPVRGLRLDLGVGAWGGAQPGAARLDIGPSLGVGVPVGRRRLRLTLDWRQRVAGDARPGSGPALSIGSDF